MLPNMFTQTTKTFRPANFRPERTENINLPHNCVCLSIANRRRDSSVNKGISILFDDRIDGNQESISWAREKDECNKFVNRIGNPLLSLAGGSGIPVMSRLVALSPPAAATYLPISQDNCPLQRCFLDESLLDRLWFTRATWPDLCNLMCRNSLAKLPPLDAW